MMLLRQDLLSRGASLNLSNFYNVCRQYKAEFISLAICYYYNQKYKLPF